MGEHKMPGQNPSGRHQPGEQIQDQARESKDSASPLSHDTYHEAARRQSRQDPLQTRGR
jgi:hypothetical protein